MTQQSTVLKVVRSALAVFLGMLASMVSIGLFQVGSTLFFPMPPGLDPNDMASLRQYVSKMPTAAFALLGIGYGVGSMIGSFVATALGTNRHMFHGLVIAFFLLLAGVMNMMAIPHPTWFIIAYPLIVVSAAYLGILSVRRLLPGPLAS